MPTKRPDYQSLLYCILKVEKTYNVKQIARAVSLDGETFSAKTLDAYTRGARRVPADLVPELYRATDDIRFLSWLTVQVGLEVVERPKGKQFSKPHLIGTLARAVEVLGFLTGDPHDKARRADLHKVLDELIPALVGLRGDTTK